MCIAGLAALTNYLREHRCLVVMDDVADCTSQLDMLLPPRQDLHPSSRVIVTSRNGTLLKQRCEAVSEVKLLPEGLAAELFASYAFQQGSPSVEVACLVPEVIECCQGLPLTLQVWHPTCCPLEIKFTCWHALWHVPLVDTICCLCTLRRSWVRICPVLGID